MSTETVYLCIFRDQQGEKIAEKVTMRVPSVGEIVVLSYLDAQGEFQVIQELRRLERHDHVMVVLELKPLAPKNSASASFGAVSFHASRMSGLVNELPFIER